MKSKTPEFKDTHSCEYDERRKILKVSKFSERPGLLHEITNTYTGEKEVKRFLKFNMDAKKSAQKQINDLKDQIEKLKDQEIAMSKGLTKLTPEQEKLIEDLRIVGSYEGVDKIRNDLKQNEKILIDMTEGMKKDNVFLESVKQKCKIKLIVN